MFLESVAKADFFPLNAYSINWINKYKSKPISPFCRLYYMKIKRTSDLKAAQI